jgi:transcriptional regulator with XRE-family HTH domain
MTPAEQFGLNLKRCRRRVRLSQEEVALRAGLHRTEIGFLENGKRSPRIDTLLKVAGAVEAAPADLLDGIEWLPGQDHDGRFSIPDPR